MKNSEIGVTTTKQEFVDYLNSVRGGQFFIIKGYTNSQNEKADHILRFGIKYDNIKNRDISFVKTAIASNACISVKVTHGAWVPELSLNAEVMTTEVNGVPATVSFESIENGITLRHEIKGNFDIANSVVFNNRSGKGRIPVTVSYHIDSTHKLFKEALETILKSLVSPRPASIEYDREGKSCYSLEKEGDTTKWYIRDVLAVQKTVIQQGDYAFKATGASVAIREAIASQYLLTSKYRQFILTAGKFDSITIEGQAIVMDTETGDDEFYLALPEHVKANAKAEALAV